MKPTVHLVQLDCAWENKRANYERVVALLKEAPPAEGSLIVLPEMFSTGFSFNTAATRQNADEREDDAFLSGLAKMHRCHVIGGVVSEYSTGRCRNEAVVFDPEGREAARYAKRQPFNIGGEGSAHEAGHEIATFEWQEMKIAPLICYDLRFPELAREAVLDHGAEVLVYIASWPSRRHQHWLTLLQARAIENLAYVIGVNRAGQDPQFSYAGRTVAVDPHGVIIADAGAQEKVLTAGIEPEVMRRWRKDFPALKDAKR